MSVCALQLNECDTREYKMKSTINTHAKLNNVQKWTLYDLAVVVLLNLIIIKLIISRGVFMRNYEEQKKT